MLVIWDHFHKILIKLSLTIKHSPNGNQVMSILQVLLKIPGGTYSISPSDEATMLVWKVPSNLSSALCRGIRWVRWVAKEGLDSTCCRGECQGSRDSVAAQPHCPHRCTQICSNSTWSINIIVYRWTKLSHLVVCPNQIEPHACGQQLVLFIL